MEKNEVCLNLFPHNQKAYEAAVTLMEENGKAAVIHPTGTGKSFIAFQLVADYPEKKFLWLSPSEYIYRTQLENLKKTLKKSFEESDNRKNTKKEKTEAGIENAVDSFLNLLNAQVTFMTYAKLMKVMSEMKDNKCLSEPFFHQFDKPDFIILDEFHRCGATEWGKSVRTLLDCCNGGKVLGLSATNIRYLDNRRDMAEELFDGCIASQMSLGEAVAKNILLAPTYVISMYSYAEELKRLQKRVEAEKNTVQKEHQQKILEQLRRSLEQADGLEVVFDRHMKYRNGKYIVFCADKEHMEEMKPQVINWVQKVDKEPHLYSVYYDSPMSESEYQKFCEDESSHLKLLFCIDMLNEGVHVEGIDGVILLRPTVSPILYLQQIGRGLSAGKKSGTPPVIFDVVNNFDSLYAVDALQKEFEESFQMTIGMEGARSKYHDSFRIIDELRDARTLFRVLTDSLNVSWDIYYREAEQYFKQNGNLRMQKKYVTENGVQLGIWLATQRRVYAGKVAGVLTETQIEKLERIGMDWEDSQEQKFNEGFMALADYRKQYGDADVSIDYRTKEDYALGRWVSNIRAAYKTGKLLPGRKEKLDTLGMIWDVRTYRWEKSYEAVAAYYDMHGNLDIPADYVDENGNCLATWLRNQKNIFHGRTKAAPLTEEQIQKLEMLGMDWNNKYEERWQKWYALAQLYYKEHGDLKVVSSYCMNGEALGKWISDVRIARKTPENSNRRLTERRIRQLDAIGMVWE